MIHIMLCGEGRAEYGQDQQEGWMQPLIRKCLPQNNITFKIKHRGALTTFPRNQKYRPLPKGHGEKALLARILAKAEDMNVVVFMVDADSKHAKEWKKLYDEIHAGFGHADNGVAGVACVPMSASESWLLADTCAWQQMGLSDSSLLPPRPEEIWGERNDPSGNHPHHYFSRICQQTNCSDDSGTRYTIATHSNKETLTKKCPISFKVFTDYISNASSNMI